MAMDQAKRCSGCTNELPLDQFQRDATQPCGRKSRCKGCAQTAQKERREGARWQNLSEADLINEIADGGPALTAFGSPIERASAETLIRAGSVAAAAAELQLEPSQLRAHLTELKRRAARRGHSPANDMQHTTPEGFHVKGVSTLYDGDGNVRQQWVKTKNDEQHQIAALLDAMSHIADSWTAKAEPTEAPQNTDDDLLALYSIGDAHLGMFAWSEETGDNFDVGLAEQQLTTAADHLVSVAPAAKQALIVSVGDFFHADSSANTTTGGTRVDVDTRWSKVLRIGIRTMRRIIDRALEKHERVRVICESGNHDTHTSVMLALCLSQYYERDPRVEVDMSPAAFHYYRFGANLIGVTHGHTVKLERLPGIMACDQPRDWGETTYRRYLVGHVHHDQVKEFPGCTVETIRTLAPKDAWHSASGYRSMQEMKLDVIHREDGQVNRHVIGIQKVKKLISRAARAEQD